MNKFNARSVIVDGEKFHSQKEATRWQELKFLERAGVITELERQVPFVIVPECRMLNSRVAKARKYIADFTYRERGLLVVEDVKGCKTGAAYQIFTLKRDLMRYWYGIEIKEV